MQESGRWGYSVPMPPGNPNPPSAPFAQGDDPRRGKGVHAVDYDGQHPGGRKPASIRALRAGMVNGFDGEGWQGLIRRFREIVEGHDTPPEVKLRGLIWWMEQVIGKTPQGVYEAAGPDGEPVDPRMRTARAVRTLLDAGLSQFVPPQLAPLAEELKRDDAGGGQEAGK